MMTYLVSGMLLVAALIHLGPIVGVLGGSRLEGLYGVVIDDPSLEILMRHRAVLFGLLGAMLGAAAFYRPWQNMAIGAGLVSVVTFMLLVNSANGYSSQIERIFWVDALALGCLLIAALIKLTEAIK
jgi:hypothetical protein